MLYRSGRRRELADPAFDPVPVSVGPVSNRPEGQRWHATHPGRLGFPGRVGNRPHRHRTSPFPAFAVAASLWRALSPKHSPEARGVTDYPSCLCAPSLLRSFRHWQLLFLLCSARGANRNSLGHPRSKNSSPVLARFTRDIIFSPFSENRELRLHNKDVRNLRNGHPLRSDDIRVQEDTPTKKLGCLQKQNCLFPPETAHETTRLAMQSWLRKRSPVRSPSRSEKKRTRRLERETREDRTVP